MRVLVPPWLLATVSLGSLLQSFSNNNNLLHGSMWPKKLIEMVGQQARSHSFMQPRHGQPALILCFSSWTLSTRPKSRSRGGDCTMEQMPGRQRWWRPVPEAAHRSQHIRLCKHASSWIPPDPRSQMAHKLNQESSHSSLLRNDLNFHPPVFAYADNLQPISMLL